MKVLIAGGTGLIGSALAATLADDGHDTTVLSRDPGKVDRNYQAASWKENELVRAVSEADAVINLAGESLAGSNPLGMRWTKKRKEMILSSRMEAGAALQAAVEKADPRPTIMIQASAIGYYGGSGEGLVDETTPAGNDFLARVCLDWEGSTKEIQDQGIRRVVIRIGLVLSQKGGLLPLLSLPFRLYFGGRLGSGQQYMSWIHINDVVGAITFLLDHPDLQGIFNLTAPKPATNKVFADSIGQTLNKPVWFPIPALAFNLLLGEAATLALDGRQVLPGRLQEAGYNFLYPELDSALRNLLV